MTTENVLDIRGGSSQTVFLLDQVTLAADGAIYRRSLGAATFQIFGTTSSGTGAATVKIHGSNDGVHWAAIVVATLTLTLGVAETEDDEAITHMPWPYVKAELNSISGTGAKVSCLMATQ